jgi:hypothetical protein
MRIAVPVNTIWTVTGTWNRYNNFGTGMLCKQFVSHLIYTYEHVIPVMEIRTFLTFLTRSILTREVLHV